MKATVLFAVLALLLASCGGGTASQKPTDTVTKPIPAKVVYTDGNYRATFSTPDSRDWTPFIEILVREGVVVSANFDYFSSTGTYKSQDVAYAEGMKAKSGITPVEVANQLVDNMIDINSGDVDVVTGATSTSDSFRFLAKAALAKALVGDTSPQTLEWPVK